MENCMSDVIIPPINGITCDSREVEPGYAFVAITGYEDDGHNYIDDAIKKGARLIIAEKPVIAGKAQVIQVEDSRAFLGKMAAQYYNYPSEKIKVVGITGTNGKTTTTHLIYNLINYKNKQAGLIGTVKIDTGNKIIPGNLTTPPSPLLQKYLAEMVANDYKYACMEVSSHGIKLKRVESTRFNIKVGTNITLDHFDLHPDFNEYIRVKKSFLITENSDTLVLINNDNKHLQQFGKIARNQIDFGINGDTAIKAENIDYKNATTEFDYQLNQKIRVKGNENIAPCQFHIKMLLPGKHNIYNALISITIGLYYGLNPEIIQKFFRNYTGVWRRLQVIYNKEFTIIDDCAHNPGSYNAVFKALVNINYKNLYIVNSLRGNRGEQINQANSEMLSRWLSFLGDYNLYTTNCNDVAKDNDLVTSTEEKIFLDTLRKNQIRFYHFQELKPALQTCLQKIKKGDLILLLGPHAMDEAGKILISLVHAGN